MSSSPPVELRGLAPLKSDVQNRILEHRLNVDDAKLEHRQHLADEKYKNTWESCCLVLDKRAVQYFTQITMICGIMSFAIIQLTRLDSCEAQQSYLGLLTLLIGILMPNPQFIGKNAP
jgi:hypothetical protein